MQKPLTNGWHGLINHSMRFPSLEKPVIQNIVYRHAEDAAFLWLQRDRLVRASDACLVDIQNIDQKIHAHINGLQAAGQAGWETAWEALQQFTEPGEMFVASVVAFALFDDEAPFLALLSMVDAKPATRRGFLSACAWCEERQVIPVMKHFFQSESLQQHGIGIAACALRRLNPGKVIHFALTQNDPGLQVCALRATGELGLQEHAHHLRRIFADQKGEQHFWAAWSLVLLGDRGPALEQLCRVMQDTQHPCQGRALSLAIRALPFDRSGDYINNMSEQDGLSRQAVIACGILGAPESIPWLIHCMSNASLVCIAGDAFSRITGVALDKEGLTTEPPCIDPEDEDGISDDACWPDPNKIDQWWQSHKTTYASGQRYLLGRKLDQEHMLSVLESGTQAVRRGVALDLMLSGHHSFLCNTAQS